LDNWENDVAPSPALRRWFDHRPDRFEEFRKRYHAELLENPAWAALRKSIGRKRVTFLYAAKDRRINHASVLSELINGNGSAASPSDASR
jgi:uncharacterized protein YeaO (DUF488 family)